MFESKWISRFVYFMIALAAIMILTGILVNNA